MLRRLIVKKSKKVDEEPDYWWVKIDGVDKIIPRTCPICGKFVCLYKSGWMCDSGHKGAGFDSEYNFMNSKKPPLYKLVATNTKDEPDEGTPVQTPVIYDSIPVYCPICGKGIYVSGDGDYACADVNCELGHGARALAKKRADMINEMTEKVYKHIKIQEPPSLIERLKDMYQKHEDKQDKEYVKLLKLLEHNNRVNQKAYDEVKASDAVKYATLDKYPWGLVDIEAVNKAMKSDPPYNLRLTQEEITILWGLLNSHKGNLCFSQILAKVEKLRPSGGFYASRKGSENNGR